MQDGESSRSDLPQPLEGINPGAQDPAALHLGTAHPGGHCPIHLSKGAGVQC